MDIKYIVEKPKNLTDEQRQDFIKLLKLQGQVKQPLEDKIESCPLLCLIYDKEFPFGIGAIKKVYKTPFDKAGISDLKSKYDIELGYIFLLNESKYRGKGYGKSICKKLINRIGPTNVFATTEESKENPMKKILLQLDFIKKGENYVGEYTGKNIGLYLLTQHNYSKEELIEILDRFKGYEKRIEGLTPNKMYNEMYNTIVSEEEVISKFSDVVTTDTWKDELKKAEHIKTGYKCLIYDEIHTVIDQIKLII